MEGFCEVVLEQRDVFLGQRDEETMNVCIR